MLELSLEKPLCASAAALAVALKPPPMFPNPVPQDDTLALQFGPSEKEHFFPVIFRRPLLMSGQNRELKKHTAYLLSQNCRCQNQARWTLLHTIVSFQCQSFMVITSVTVCA